MSFQLGIVRFFDEKNAVGVIEGLNGGSYIYRKSDEQNPDALRIGLTVLFRGVSSVPPQAYDVSRYRHHTLDVLAALHDQTSTASPSLPAEGLIPTVLPFLTPRLPSPTHRAGQAPTSLPATPAQPLPPHTALDEANRVRRRSTLPTVTLTPTPCTDTPRRTGRISFFYRAKGFGFIRDEDKVEYFFHHNDNPELLSTTEGLEVEFDTQQAAGKHHVASGIRPRTPAGTPDRPIPARGGVSRSPIGAPLGNPVEGGLSPKSPQSSRSRLGYVRFYFHKKQFGFILGSGGEDCFFAQCALLDGDVDNLEGSVVSFQLTVGRKGLQARRIRRLAVSIADDDMSHQNSTPQQNFVPSSSSGDLSVSSDALAEQSLFFGRLNLTAEGTAVTDPRSVNFRSPLS